ncbi:MAG TPA: hypothetical protein VGJ04_03855 [Pirellulales bacterium]
MARCFTLLWALIVALGCSSQGIDAQVAAMNNANIKRVANLYAAYQNSNRGEGPKNLAALKQYTEGIPSENLEMMKIDLKNFDSLFISERDGKPFKIKYGVMHYPLTPPDAVVFESEGRGGTKQVAWTSSKVDDVDEARYNELWGEKQAPVASSTPPAEAKGPGDAAKQPPEK